MKIHEILCEKIINLHKTEDKALYADEVWDILNKSYSKIGGFKSAASKEELVDKSGLWKLITRNGEITALNIYKNQYGRKSIATGTNGMCLV